MSKPRNRRWRCPNGEHPGVLASYKMRKIDVRRYCLPCSEAEGVLVERVCAAREKSKKRTRAKQAIRQKKIAAKRAKERAADREWRRAHKIVNGLNVAQEFARVQAHAIKLHDVQVRAEIVRRGLTKEPQIATRFSNVKVELGDSSYLIFHHDYPEDIPHLGVESGDRAHCCLAAALVRAFTGYVFKLKGDAPTRAAMDEVAEAAYGCTYYELFNRDVIVGNRRPHVEGFEIKPPKIVI